VRRLHQAAGGEAGAEGGRLAWVKGALAGALGLLLAWLFFYGIGQALVQIPAPQDEGSAWQRR